MRAILPLVLLAACSAVATDPSNSGVPIAPSPGDQQAPVDLAILNRTDDVLVCVVVEEDLCPALTQEDLDALAALAPRTRWDKKDVSCLLADFRCAPEGAAANEPPLRAWSWYVDDLGL